MRKTVANFSTEYQQYLDPAGNWTEPLPSFAANATEITAMYKAMVLTRIFDEKAIALQRTGKLGTYPSIYGQEALSIGMASAMQANDIFCPYYREQGAMLCRGVTMEEILVFWGGSEVGNNYQGPTNDMPHSIPIGSQTVYATGIATAQKFKQTGNVVVAALGDGATSRGDFYEAMNIAGIWELPVIFFINNNQYAISVPRDAQSKTQTLAQKSIAAGINGIQVDGNDVIGVRLATDEALARARAGKGATVIEALSYRLGDHTTADDARRYRNEAELAEAKLNDPFIRTKKFLSKQHGWTEEQEQALYDSCKDAVEAAVANYLATPKQKARSIFAYMYATMPAALEEQMTECLRFEQDNA